MFNKLLAFFIKTHDGYTPVAEETAAPSSQEECKFSVLGIIKIRLRNPSPRMFALVRLFLLLIAIIAALLILRPHKIDVTVPPSVEEKLSGMFRPFLLVTGKKNWGPGSIGSISIVATHFVHRHTFDQAAGKICPIIKIYPREPVN